MSASRRSSIHFTGRSRRCAAAATAISSRPTTHFCPNPPPMSGTVTRTVRSAIRSERASIVRTWWGTCEQVCTSSWSSRASHDATTPRVSSGSAFCRPLRVVTSTREGGVRERLVHPRGVEHRDVEQHVVGGLVVHRGRAGGERRLLRDDGVERVVGDPGGLDAVLHGVRVAGDDERQRLADEAHLAAGEDRHRGGRELLGGPVEDGDDVAERQVRGVVGRDDAVDLAGRGEVQLRDRGVRDRGAHEARVQHPGQSDVVDEAAAPGEQARVLVPGDRGADPAAAAAVEAGLGGGPFAALGLVGVDVGRDAGQVGGGHRGPPAAWAQASATSVRVSRRR